MRSVLLVVFALGLGAGIGVGSDKAGAKSCHGPTCTTATTRRRPPPPPRRRRQPRRRRRRRQPPSGPCGTKIGAQPATYTHIIWIIFENHSYSEIIGSPSAPYLNSLATQCGVASSYSAITHPSLPNYLALTSGSTQGVADDNPPASHPLAGASIFSQTGWRSLEQSMPVNCDLADASPYAVRHNPAAYYTSIAGACSTADVPLGPTPDVSAPFTFVTPDLCNDMHDCSVATGDSWLSSFLPSILGSPTYTGGGTAIFITWDEDDGSATNQVPLLVLSPYTAAGSRASSALDHYSLLRTTEDLLGLGCLANACTATDFGAAFGLR